MLAYPGAVRPVEKFLSQ